MDKTKPPGIAIERINLLWCDFGVVDHEAPRSFSLHVTSYSRTQLEQDSLLGVTIEFDLMKGIPTPPLKFRCAFGATYSRSKDANMAWEELSDHVIVAHLLPYLREFVSNMTARLSFPAIMLPPFNAHQLIARYQEQARNLTAGADQVALVSPTPES